jgi:glycyl-tRNA synthetase beta chain
MKRAFALELGVEEMPSRFVPDLVDQLHRLLAEAFQRHRLPHADLWVDATPRRLWAVGQVEERQEASARRVKGPPLDRARLPDGSWSPAALGFARRVGLAPEALAPGDGPEEGYLVATVTDPADPADKVLPAVWQDAVAGLEVPRTMRWNAGDARFVRPVRWVLALLDDEVLAVEMFGLKAGRLTFGNRTDHPEAVAVSRAEEYLPTLERLKVEATTAARRRRIEDGAARLAAEVGGRSVLPPALLAEVADLVEWPVPFLGRFDVEFLRVPAPVLETAMMHHQRYFPVRGEEGLLPAFVGVRNGEGTRLDQVVAGNEKVLRARLADARFFFAEDQKRSLEDRVDALDGVVFHAQLGTYGDKRRRLERLAEKAAPILGLDAAETRALRRAATLAKADLLTHVVGEFPELQGVMGGIYARLDGEADWVAAALADQYHPDGADDRLPEGRVAQGLALLDRLDTLAGFERAGLRPRGSEDPFALRRAALGVLRLVTEGNLPAVDLDALVELALEEYGDVEAEHRLGVVEFVLARARAYWGASYRADVVEAAIAGTAPLTSLPARLSQLAARLGRPEFETLATTYKRAAHLAGSAAPDRRDRYPEAAEQQLARALEAAERAAGGDAADDPYWEAAVALGPAVAHFFDQVLVMDPDPDVRARRLGLLAAVAAFLRRGADLSRITGERGVTV